MAGKAHSYQSGRLMSASPWYQITPLKVICRKGKTWALKRQEGVEGKEREEEKGLSVREEEDEWLE